jgi:transcriptional regulator with XRE-family HTH domain
MNFSHLTTLIPERPEGHEDDSLFGSNIGFPLRRMREIMGLSQSELACRSDVNLSYICAIENYPSNISIKKQMQICNGMNVDPSILTRIIGLNLVKARIKSELSRQWRQISTGFDPALMQVADASKSQELYQTQAEPCES